MSSNVVDSKIVELLMRNENFESNAVKSLSTLDKLKKALDFKGEYKGLDNISDSVKKVNVGALTSGVETLKSSLHSLGQIAVFSMIADEAIKAKNAVEGFVKEVTVGQVSAGWDKYAQKTSAVQTIMAATAKDFSDTGEQMEFVNAQMDKLNWFTDETSYNFVDMVGNIGKFTSNNIKLEDAVTAMQGISTWAAKSGAGVNEASRAMYNLSQAIGTGSVQIRDWFSIENANMATAEFKQTVIDTAESMGLLEKATDDTWKTMKGHEVTVASFRENLADDWFSSEVLVKSLERYGKFTDELYRVMSNMNEGVLTSDMFRYIEQFKDGTIDLAAVSKETGLSIKDLQKELTLLGSEEMEFGMKALQAAQEAKTFQEAVDSVKDAVSTGWMNTFELMFGDYVHAKELWTDLANNLYDIFAEGGNARNALIKEAFDHQTGLNQSDWDKLTESGLASPEFISAVRKAAGEHGRGVNEMVDDQEWLRKSLERGLLQYEDLQTAFEQGFDNRSEMAKQIASIKEADDAVKGYLDTIDKYDGDDLSKIIFGNGKYEEGYEELEGALDGLLTSLGLEQSEGQKVIDSLLEMRGVTKSTADEWQNLTDAQLRQRGMTEEEIKQFREAESAGSNYAEVLDEIKKSHMSGGELWTESLQNAMNTVVELVSLSRDLWSEVFPPMSSTGLYDIVDGIHTVTSNILEFVQTSEDLRNVIKGVFSGFDLVLGVVTTLGKAGFGALRGFVEGLGIDLWALAGGIGNLVTKFHDWFMESDILGKALDFVTDSAKSAGEKVRSWVTAFAPMPLVQRNLNRFKLSFKQAFSMIGPYMEEGSNRFNDFLERCKSLDGLSIDNIKAAFTDFKENVLDYFLDFPGFKIIGTAFKMLANDFREHLKAMGVDVEKVDAIFAGFGNFVETTFGYLKTAGKAALELGRDVFDTFLNMPAVKKHIDNFGAGFKSIFDNMGTYLSIGKTKIDDFIKKVQDMGGLKLDNLGEVFKMFKEDVLDHFLNYEGFKPFRDAVDQLKTDIRSKLSDFGINIDEIRGRVVSFFDQIRAAIEETPIGKAISGIFDFFNGSEDKAEEADKAGDSVKSFAEKISDAFATLQPVMDQLKDILKSIAAVLVALITLRALHDVATIFDGITGLMKAQTKAANAKAFITFAAGVAALAFAASKLSEIDVPALWKGVGAVAVLSAVLGGLMIAVTKLGNGKEMQSAGIGILAAAGAVDLLVGAMLMMDQIDKNTIERNIDLLKVLMVWIAGLAVVLGKAGATSFGGGLGVFLAVASLYMIMDVLKRLETFEIGDPDAVRDKFLQLVAALGAIFLATKLAGANALGAAASILAISFGLILIAAAFKILETIDGSEDNLKKLDQLVEGIEVMMTILLLASHFAGGSFGSILAMAIMIGVLAVTLAGLTLVPQDKLESVRNALAVVIGITAALSLVTGLAKPAISSILMLILLVGSIALAIGLLANLTDVNAALTAAIAIGFLAGALTLSLMGLTVVGTFAPAAIAGVLLLGKVVGVLAIVALALAALNAIFGPGFGEGITAGLDLLVTICNGIGTAIGSLFSGFGEGFGEGLTAISEGISDFAAAMNDIGAVEIDTEGLLALVTAIGAISFEGFGEAIQTKITELLNVKSPMETFTENMSQLATALLKWKIQMTLIGNITVPTEAINSLVAALDAVPNSGLFQSIASFFTGAPDLEAFSTNLGQLGAGLSAFKTAVGDDLDATELNEMASAINVLGELGNVLKGQDFGGWFSKNDYTQFGTSLVGFGEKLQEFTAIEIDTEKLSSIATASNTLATMGTTLSTIDLSSGDIASADTIATFVANLQTLSDSISGLASIDTSGVTSLSTAVTSLNAIDLSSALKKPSETDTDFTASGTTAMTTLSAGITASSGSVSSAITDVMSSAASAAGAQSAAFTTQGQTLINALAHGIAQNGGIVTAAVQTVASNAASAAGGYSGQFVNAGFQMAAGLAGGIAAGASMAIAAAIAMAAAALAAAKAVLAVHSPSRETYELGEFFGLGFTNAISDHTGVAYDTAAGMAGAARQGLDDAVQGIRDVLTSDIDANPVIRPVLDLTEIQNGANSMSDMLAINEPIGLVGNINAISSNMNSRNRSGDELTMALKSLQRTMSNQRTGDTYNLNGITYDDGSNVATAVRQLVRAARVERRA